MCGGEGDGVGRFLNERICPMRGTRIIPAYRMPMYGVPITTIFSAILTHIASIIQCSSGVTHRAGAYLPMPLVLRPRLLLSALL